MFKLRGIFGVDFLNNIFLFKLRGILEVYFILIKSRSINEVLLKYKVPFYFFLFLYFIYTSV